MMPRSTHRAARPTLGTALAIALATALTTLAACSAADAPGKALAPGGDEERIEVTNDSPDFAGRVQITNRDTVPLSPDSAQSASAARAYASVGPSAPSVTTFIRTALVTPPTLNGAALQASHVVVKDDYAFVSYMTLGDATQGALEVFDISSPSSPRLVSQALLKNSDVLALAVDDNYVYLATSSDDPTQTERRRSCASASSRGGSRARSRAFRSRAMPRPGWISRPSGSS